MKRKVFELIIFICLCVTTLLFAQTKAIPPAQELPVAEDSQEQTVWFPFNGQWLPDQDASLIGPTNYKTLQNLRYNDAAIEGVNGYSKINTTPITTYTSIRNGIQLTSERTTKSYVLVQAQDGSANGQVFYNTTAIPSQGNFSGTALHTDAAGYDLPRFSTAPSGNIAYSNSKESKIWAGTEMRVAGFFTGDDAAMANPADYTDAVNDTLTTAGHTVALGPLASRPNWLVLSTRPLDGVKYYVGAAANDACTLSAKYWDGSAFTSVSSPSDGTRTGSISFAKTGTFSFTSTAAVAKPYHFNGLYLYAYLFTLDAQGTSIYHVSVSAPFQTIVDVWDGVHRQPIQCQVSMGAVYEDYTLDVNESSYLSVPIGADVAALLSTDHFILMFDDRMSGVKMDMLAGLVNTNASTMTVKYKSITGWQSLTITDGTAASSKTLNQSGLISWTPYTGTTPALMEIPQTIFGVTGYAYQFTVSATLSGTHGSSDTIIDRITGIPAQKTVKPFRFSSLYKNRLFLGGHMVGNEGNRVDYSATNAPDVWNGLDSSNDGMYSLYFGGQEPLTAGVQLYNRFGSNIFSTWVAFKDNETYLLTGDNKDDFKIYPISLNIGCPAPLTVATAELGFEVAQEAQRNVVMWLSNRGPMMFDGAIFVPIRGVDKYFDPVNTECINTTYFKNARGWYDPNYKEYNLLIPSGSAQVTNNVWLVYDLVRKKWFQKDTGVAAMPQTAFQVIDTAGKKYVYAGIDTGYMMRLENTYRWDSTSITQTVETGDFYPTKSPWEITRLRRLKLAAKTTSESCDVTVTHYTDTDDTSATVIALVALDSGSGRVFRETEPINSVAWTHRFKFETTTSATLRGFSPTMWGMGYFVQRVDKATINPFTETPTITQVSDGRSKYYVNYLSTDQGVDDNSESLFDLCDSVIGTTRRATVVFKHWRLSGTSNTTYTVSTTTDLSAYTNINFEFEKGAVLSIDAGKTLTLPSAANVMAQPTQHIFTGAGTPKFSNPDGEASIKWFGALGDGITDDTAAITNAVQSRGISLRLVDGTFYHYSVTALYFPGGTYVVSDTIIPTCGSGKFYSDEQAIIYCNDPAKDIFDFSGGFKVEFSGIKLEGGKRQIRFGNNNTSNAELILDRVGFYYNNSDAAIEFYLVAPATNLSAVCVLNHCEFIDSYQCIETVPGVQVYLNDGWLIYPKTGNAGRALFVNKGSMIFRGMYGSPGGNASYADARWVDNYGDFYASDSRFGGEGSGMPVVYQYDVARTSYVGGGCVDLKSNAIVCGDATQNTIIHLVTGIPQRITIRDNDWISKISTSDFISIDSGFDIATYIGALDTGDMILIDIGNNASSVLLELIGLPTLLTDTNKSQVIVNTGFKPFTAGFRKKALLHFNGANNGTTIIDEYLNQGNWTVAGNAQLSTSVKRFGPSALALDGTGDYVTNATTTSLGTAFTIEGWWLTADNTKQDQAIFSGINGTGYGVYLLYNSAASTHMALYVSSNGTTWNVANAEAGAATFTNNTWYKWVIEFTGATYKAYIGTAGTVVTEDISVTSSSVPCAITAVNLGYGTQGGLDEFRMLIGDYRYGGLFIPESEPFKID